MSKLLTTKDVSDKLGVTMPRVHALIQAGRLPAEKFGRDYVIKESDLALVAERKPGRPKKESVALTEDEKQFVETMAKAIKATEKPADSSATASVASSTKATKTMTAAQKKAIRDEQQRRWAGPTKKATTKVKR